jgi:hypothetical protein
VYELTQTEDVREQGAEENVRNKEEVIGGGGGGRRKGIIAKRGI